MGTSLLNTAIQSHPLIHTDELRKTLPQQKSTTPAEESSSNLHFWLRDKNYLTIKDNIKQAFNEDKNKAAIKCCQIRAALTAYYQLIDESIDRELTSISNQVSTLDLSTYTPKNKVEETPSRFKSITFTVFALSLGFFEMIAGIAGMYEILIYGSSILGLTISVPVAGAISLVFGLISASVAAVFDIYAVAQAMKVPYLTACQELKNLIKQSEKIIESHCQINESLNTLCDNLSDEQPLKTIEQNFNTLKEQLNTLAIIQHHVDSRIKEFQHKIEMTQTKRKAYQFIWVLLALPIYAGTVVISANAAIALLPTFGLPPVGLAVAATFALAWVAVELYRFLSFERTHMIRGLDSLIFGSPENRFNTMQNNAAKMEKKLAKNQKLSTRLTKDIQTHQDAETALQAASKSKGKIVIFSLAPTHLPCNQQALAQLKLPARGI